MKLEAVEKENYWVVNIQLEPNEVIEPETLKANIGPELSGPKGVILNGRGPIWLYGYLIHKYHATKWIAVNDPRIGAVVISSHSSEYKPGDVIKTF